MKNLSVGPGSGPIPAGTGETAGIIYPIFALWAYPRRHGGNYSQRPVKPGGEGLSPQARGKLHQRRFHVFTYRPIPAGTGETKWMV